MSEAFFNPSSAAASRPGPSAGALLRRAREAAGLHVAALAVAMKVPVRRLEALEADRWDDLPDIVFIRALAASVCRTLKIDPAPVLERLPQVTQRMVEDRPGINRPFHDPRSGRATGLFAEMSRPLLGAIVALVVAAALIAAQPIWSPWIAEHGRSGGSGGEPAVVTAVAPPVAVSSLPRVPEAVTSTAEIPVGGASTARPVEVAVIGTVTLPTAPTVVAPAPAAALVPAPPPVVVASSAALRAPSQPLPPVAAASRPVPSPSASVPAAVVAAAPGVFVRAASAPVGAAPAELISVRVNAEVWVSITDGKGQSLIRRAVQPGEAVAASGSVPLFVVIGRVQAAQVQVRGRPFDTTGIAKDNVARFEVR
jgi:cytoskeleton protein RodZ